MKKYSRKIPTDQLKTLLARSGNQCAFPGCSHPIFDDNNLFVAQLCHIEAVSPNGQRHNPNTSDEETNSYNNLLFLCYRHHKETDNTNLYPTNKLKEIKIAHEAQFKEVTYKYSKEVFDILVNETNAFWANIEELHAAHIIPDLSVSIDINTNILSLILEINKCLSNLNEINAAIMEDCKTSHFEYICIGMPNMITQISIALDQIEIKYMEELIVKNPANETLREKLKIAREKFKAVAQSAGYSD